MTDNSNERDEARRLIEEAFADAALDVDGTPCPLGDNCSMHHRVDEETIYGEQEYGRLVSYVGEYVVITSDNPDLDDPIAALKMMIAYARLGELETAQETRKLSGEEMEEVERINASLPPLYETCVIHVGDKAVADLRKLPMEDQRNSIRFVEKHSSWDNFKSAHEIVVSGVLGGDIDVSTPVSTEEM